MIRFLYKFAVMLAGIILIPRALFRGFLGDRGELESLGIYPAGKKMEPERSIWIHFSSVGESKIAGELINAFKELNPDAKIVCTCRTSSGKREALRLFGDDVELYYCPYELRVFVRKAIRHFNAEKLVLIETELWPILIEEAVKGSLKIFLVNGRISEKSYPNYRKFGKYLRKMLGDFTAFIMQTDEDKKRIIGLGADPGKCETAANIKYDIMRRQIAEISSKDIRLKLGINPEDKIIIAGSTRAGEEKIIIEQFLKLKARHPGIKLILAPRHLKRLPEVESYVRSTGLAYCLRSHTGPDNPCRDKGVMILDTMGELASMYSVCRAAFIGGSLVPLGGQNPLEPVALGVPTCFGPHMENFTEIAVNLLNMGLAVRVNNPAELYEFFGSVLEGKASAPDPSGLFQKYGKSAVLSAKKILEM